MNMIASSEHRKGQALGGNSKGGKCHCTLFLFAVHCLPLLFMLLTLKIETRVVSLHDVQHSCFILGQEKIGTKRSFQFAAPFKTVNAIFELFMRSSFLSRV